MDVRQLEAFLAVAEHLHFGRAAEQLFMAPAPLSRLIQALEADLSTRLFERNTRTVSLTPAGRALVGPAKEVLGTVRRAEAGVAAAVTGEEGIVRVEFCGVAAHPLVAALARGVRADNPGIRMELTSQAVSRPTIQRLLDAEVDVGLGRFDSLPPGLESEVLIADSLVVALPRTHRLAGAQVVAVEPDAVHVLTTARDLITLDPADGLELCRISLLAHGNAMFDPGHVYAANRFVFVERLRPGAKESEPDPSYYIPSPNVLVTGS